MQGPIGGETGTSEGWKPETELTISLVGPVSKVAVKVMGNMHDGRDEGDLRIGGHQLKRGVVSGYAPKDHSSRLVMCFFRSAQLDKSIPEAAMANYGLSEVNLCRARWTISIWHTKAGASTVDISIPHVRRLLGRI